MTVTNRAVPESRGKRVAIMANRLEAIRKKVEAGERLDFDDGLALEASDDLLGLGELANLVRERKNGNFGYYNVNTHLNPTNVCVFRCDFCAFRADLDEDRAYVLGREQVIERARQAHDRGATEMHVVGGLHHKLPFEYYVDVVRWIKEAAPEIHVKAYTGVEVEFFARISRLSIRGVLERLIDAGLGSLPGGGAEIFHPEVRDQICGAKASTETWLDVHRTAHRLGLHSNATMLYGHIEGPTHRIDHLIRLRELQDETGGFQTFIPLAFHQDNSRMDEIPQPSGLMDLKTMAISRLMLDNFPHIKAYWVMLGIKPAQVAHSVGADDIDGTVVHEKIYHDAGAETPQEVSVGEIRRLIAEAGRLPVERDTLYRRVERAGGRWTAREHVAGLIRTPAVVT
jgi:aminodeoxyfutalosine synthase